MAGFGFIPNDPNDPSDPNDPENNRPDFEAMMRQMQEQLKAQFEQLGINPVGFVNPFTSLFPGSANTSPGGKDNGGKEEVLSISADTNKIMGNEPRRIARIEAHIRIQLGQNGTDRQREGLERVVKSCPVSRSLHPEVEQSVTIEWI